MSLNFSLLRASSTIFHRNLTKKFPFHFSLSSMITNSKIIKSEQMKPAKVEGCDYMKGSGGCVCSFSLFVFRRVSISWFYTHTDAVADEKKNKNIFTLSRKDGISFLLFFFFFNNKRLGHHVPDTVREVDNDLNKTIYQWNDSDGISLHLFW